MASNFEIFAKPPVIYTVQNATFSDMDVDAYFEAIVETAAPFKQWILFEHPTAAAVMTDSAVKATVQHYQSLSKTGCVGISLMLSNIVARVLRHEDTLSQLDIPFRASRNAIELSKFVDHIANGIENQGTLESQAG